MLHTTAEAHTILYIRILRTIDKSRSKCTNCLPACLDRAAHTHTHIHPQSAPASHPCHGENKRKFFHGMYYSWPSTAVLHTRMTTSKSQTAYRYLPAARGYPVGIFLPGPTEENKRRNSSGSIHNNRSMMWHHIYIYILHCRSSNKHGVLYCCCCFCCCRVWIS